MSRTFTDAAASSPEIEQLLATLVQQNVASDVYRDTMLRLGERLGEKLVPRLNEGKDICVVCTVEDADFLGRGVIDALESAGFGSRLHLVCLWNDRLERGELSVAPILRSYEEKFDTNETVFIVVKSIISGACVVKTNLMRVLATSEPQRVFVVAPVFLTGAESRLAEEFPSSISSKFEFLHFATDTEQSPDGQYVVPGIGGSVYELLGFGSIEEKNRYVPEIVKERRRREFPQLNVNRPPVGMRPRY